MRAAFVAIAAAVTALAQQPAPPVAPRLQDQFQEAITLMETRGDCAAAVRLFEAVGSAKGADRGLAAQAWIYVGRCRERLGQAEAAAAYRRVIEQFGDQLAAVRQARERLAAIERSAAVSSPPLPSRRQAWEYPGNVFVIGVPAANARLVPWIEGPDEVVVADLDTGKARRRFPARPAGAAGGAIDVAVPPVLSPEGTEAAFAWAGDVSRLCVASPDGGVRVLASGEKGETLAPVEWRPGGLLLVSAAGPDAVTRLMVVSAADGAVRTTIRVQGRKPHATLSPDGRFLAFDVPAAEAPAGRDILVAASAGGDPMPLVTGESDDFFPLWTPDGRRVLFVSDRAGPNGLWAVPMTGGRAAGAPQLLQRDIGEVLYPLGMTAAGALYYVRQVGLVNVYVVEIGKDGRPLRAPSPVDPRLGGLSLGSSWAPDGRLVYLTSVNSGSLAIWDPQRNATRPLPTGLLGVRGPSWSPDGRWILVSGIDRSGAWGSHLVDPESGTTRRVTCVAGRDGAGARNWTLDAKALACEQGGVIVARPLDGGDARELFRLPPGARLSGIPNLTVSRATGLFAFSLRAGDASTLNVQTRDAGVDEVFRVASPDAIDAVNWMPDNRALVFIRGRNDRPVAPGENPPAVWIIGLEDRTPRPLGIAADGLRNLRVSPDGRYLTFTAGWPGREVTVIEHFLPG
jgi:Tol biopolymer transport system component